MSRDKVNSEIKENRDSNQDVKDITWGRFIFYAEEQIKTHQRAIIGLRKSIRFFAEQQVSGKPFPLQGQFLCRSETSCAGKDKCAKPLEGGAVVCSV